MDQEKTILLVEDSPTQAMMTQHFLEQEGWQVKIAETGDDALKYLKSATPELVVLDFYLPDIRGDELCRQIRMNVNTRGIPILMLTVLDTQAAELRGLESGADDYLPKSSDTDILILKIRTLLKKQTTSTSDFQKVESHFHRVRIIAVDDSPTYLELLRIELESEGYTVDTASTAEDGLQKISDGNYDCALVDLVMPGMDGIEMTGKINELKTGMESQILVLMITGRDTKEDLTRALEAGADDFVGKGSDMAVLKGRIRALLRRKFYEESNKRILTELKEKELEAQRLILERKAAEAEAHAALAKQLQELTTKLKATNASLRQEVDKRREAQEELAEKATELQRSHADLVQFANVASHDLQTPLRSISGCVQLLMRQYSTKLDDRAADLIGLAVKGAARMQVLINDLHVYAQLETTKREELQIDTGDIVSQAVKSLESSINENDASVTFENLPTVFGNPLEFDRLFQNLIDNAIKFRSEKSPVIEITAQEITGDQVAELGHYGKAPESENKIDTRNRTSWLFRVRDNGIGIDKRYGDRIFDMYKTLQGDSEASGTGIGLAISKKIVERHGGRIWYESECGKGATFLFIVSKPRSQSRASKEPRDASM